MVPGPADCHPNRAFVCTTSLDHQDGRANTMSPYWGATISERRARNRARYGVFRGMIGEFGPMHPVKGIAFGLLALPVAEIAAFIVVASLVGTSTAVVLLVLVSLAGAFVLRHVGSGAVTRLRGANAQIAGVTLDGGGIAAALGGILLIIPGFITGLLGALVVFPVSRGWLLWAFRRLFSRDQRPSGPQVVDLAPDEWRALPHPRLPSRKRRPKA